MNTDKEYMDELDLQKAKCRFSDKELAKAVGTTVSMISQWRTGSVSMSPASKKKIFSFLEKMVVLEKAIKDESKTCFLDKCPATPPADNFLKEILEVWNDLNKEERARVAGLASKIADDKKGASCTNGHCLEKEA